MNILIIALDIGQNNYVVQAIGKAKYPHYGVDFFNSTPSGRFGNGLNFTDFVESLQPRSKLRKFAILGIPYIGCTPLLRVTSSTRNCSQTANDLAAQLNTGLEQLLRNMMISSKGMLSLKALLMKISDFWFSLADLRNVTDACCGLGRFNAMTNCLPVASLCENREMSIFFGMRLTQQKMP
ncbi:SGNH hydrolase-type esterase domain-containing protein [Artemisia annua]|uniref:SGNH hydrolase-type esterase domain-containing protein n=1 Tax=Artemisia annua TaxID=35608 RepID=A0A2U1NP61_ARTAN|nr:SGNH hydrolase-type esterase domain-containing protein [Artemisia annua]